MTLALSLKVHTRVLLLLSGIEDYMKVVNRQLDDKKVHERVRKNMSVGEIC